MSYIFTSESVSEGHPDKVADQISDALLDNFLARDPYSKVACETLVTTGLVVLSGEVNTNAYIDVQDIAREVIRRIGYTKGEYMFESNSCGVISTIHGQSPDINQGVVRQELENQGAGDQGIMFGYATNETSSYMPLTLVLSHELLKDLAAIRREGKVMTYLRPDSKSQVTIEYDDNTHQPLYINTIVISTQHDDFDTDDKKMLQKIKSDVQQHLLPRTFKRLGKDVEALITDKLILHVNPTGKFVIGGPHGDTGLTGRKIIVDAYGGHGAHGGGAFSGKDSSKVDRSAAYAARYLAKNLVAAGVADKILVQLAYAIGVAKPVGIYVNTYQTRKKGKSDSEIANILPQIFDLRPYSIVQKLGLTNPIFEPTASYGHFGREYYKAKVKVYENNREVMKEVEFFSWEKLDLVDKINQYLQ